MGVKKSGEYKKLVPKSRRRRSIRRSRCLHGVKKSGGCKKKSGPKSRRRRSHSRRRKTTYMTLARCKEELKEKIKINTREYNDGKYANRKQAIAVAYSQIKRKYPQYKDKI
jgi:hypothetical protein